MGSCPSWQVEQLEALVLALGMGASREEARRLPPTLDYQSLYLSLPFLTGILSLSLL